MVVAEAFLMRGTMAMALLLLLGLCSVSPSAASALPSHGKLTFFSPSISVRNWKALTSHALTQVSSLVWESQEWVAIGMELERKWEIVKH